MSKCIKIGKAGVISLPSTTKEAVSTDELLEIVINRYKDKYVSFNIDGNTMEEQTISPKTLKEDLEAFLDMMMSTLASIKMDKEGFDLSLNSPQSQLIRKALEIEYFPKIGEVTTDVDEDFYAQIGTKYNLLERQSMKLSRALEVYFLNNKPAELHFKDKVREEIALNTFIHIPEGSAEGAYIVDSEQKLNQNIEDFLSGKFEVILKYLKSLNAQDLAGYMYKTHNTVKKFLSTMDKMLLIIQHKKDIGQLQADIESGYIALALDPNYKPGEVPTFFEALSAYLTIKYFDDLTKESIGSYISSNKLTEIIEEHDDGVSYKYHFGKDTENRVAGWLVNIRDAIKEMGNFSKFLILLIPVRDTKMTIVNYLNAFTKLFEMTPYIRNSIIYSEIVNFGNNPVLAMKTILTRIHESYQGHLNGRNDTLYDTLSRNDGLNEYDFLILDAIYNFVFGNLNSLYNIERNFNRKYGLTNRYSLVECLAGQVLSSTSKNYLEVVTEEDGVKVRVKRKFSIDNVLFEIYNNVNTNNINAEAKHNYKFDLLITKDKSVFTVNLNGTYLRIKVNTTVSNMGDVAQNLYGLLSKGLTDSGIEVEVLTQEESLKFLKDGALNPDAEFESLTSFMSRFSIDTYNNRKLLYSSLTLTIEVGTKKSTQLKTIKNANGDLIELLRFVDYFAGTNFSIDENGLLELYLLSVKYSPGLQEATTTAMRGLFVNYIYKEFAKELNKDNTSYNITELPRFIKDKGLYPIFKIEDINQRDKAWSEIWKTLDLGNMLITIRPTQKWLQLYVEVKHIMSGEISQANTRNLSGDLLPNYGLAFMGSNMLGLLNDSLHKPFLENGTLSSNLFALNQGNILRTVIDTEVKLQDGTSKLVKNMEEGELYTHAIIDKFLTPYVNGLSYIIVQPTTYSDKTSFVNYMVSTILLNGENLMDMETSRLEDMFVTTIGNSYKKVLKNVIEDYVKIFPSLAPLYKLAYSVGKVTGVVKTNYDKVKDLVIAIDGLLRMLTLEATALSKELKHTITPETLLILKAKDVGVTIYLDTHFRPNAPSHKVDGKKKKVKFLAFNELLYNYATSVYDKSGIKQRLRDERRKFVKELIKSNFKFGKINVDSFGYITDSSPIGQAFKLMHISSANWVADGKVVLARTADLKPITKVSELDQAEDFEINPVLDRYFLINNLVNNNLRLLLTGSEINHKNKHLIGINLGLKILAIASTNLLKIIRNITDKMAQERGIDPDEFFNSLSFFNIQEIIKSTKSSEVKAALDNLYKEQIYTVEAAGLGAQLKRNVIIPATMRYYMRGTIRGIGDTMKVAVMEDIQASVFNFSGLRTTIDAHDGAAWINPITSILENWSLLENEVGTVKKPIWHYYDGLHMTASLVKFAAHTMTNAFMRQSEDAPVKLHNIFKKISNQDWNEALRAVIEEKVRLENELNAKKGKLLTEFNPNAPINIFNLVQYRKSTKLKFEDVTGGVMKSENANGGIPILYYLGNRGVHYAITDIGFSTLKDDDDKPIPGLENTYAYTTTEGVSDYTGSVPSEQYTVYHYFDDAGNHFKELRQLTSQEMEARGLHTTRSIYELHEMLGGINSESRIENEDGNKVLDFSEASNYAVANIINSVAIRRANLSLESSTLGLSDYIQPLKTLMIDYVCNNTAIKNGAGNRNSADRFYNDEALDYITMSTLYYGIQLDADHEADESEMTEFSQVISALDAGGRLHGYVKDIYKALGQIALAEASIEMESITAYLQNPNSKTRDALYDIIGKTILDNIRSGKGKLGLADAIIGQIKHKFNLTSTHTDNDLFKIPFSDDNIYGSILSTYASIITNKSIRKKYPGTGAVLSPGYNMAVVYEINGQTYQRVDVLKKALIAFNSYASIEDEEERKANEYYEYFEPLLNDDGPDLNNRITNAYLLKFTNDYNKDKYYYNIETVPDELPDYKYYLETFKPTDKIGVRCVDENNVEFWYDEVNLDDIDSYYAFKAAPREYVLNELSKNGIKLIRITGFRKNLHVPRNLAPTRIWWEYDLEYTDALGLKLIRHRVMNIFDTPLLIEAYASGNTPNVQALLDELETGKWTYEGVQYDIKLHNQAAELLMSNIYLTRFGVTANTSLVDIIEKEGKFFAKKLKLVRSSTILLDFYDIILQKSNLNHTYISLNRDFTSIDVPDDLREYKGSSWGKKHRKTVRRKGSNIVNEVYAMDDENRVLFMIGKDIIREDIVYDSVNKVYLENGKAVNGNFHLDNEGNIIEYVEFVTKHLVTQTGKNKKFRHRVYNIDTSALERTVESNIEKGKTKTTNGVTVDLRARDINLKAQKVVKELIRDMYNADSYQVLTINDLQMSVSRTHMIKNIMLDMHKYFTYNRELASYLETLYDSVIKNIPEAKGSGVMVISDNFKLIREGDALMFKLSNKKKGDDTKGLKDFYNINLANYTKVLSRKRKASFTRSLYYTASRIPAQTLQSFMNMLLVGFTGESGNQAYVSHWLTWLQGSDYDIDKAYVMGFAFDENGSYIGWSSLFDYFDLNTIRASEYLPMPDKKIAYTKAQKSKGVDIDALVKLLLVLEQKLESTTYTDPEEESADRVAILRLYCEIFNMTKDNTLVYYNGVYGDKVVDKLNMHNRIGIPTEVRPLALRNFVSSHIQNTIQNVRNAADSYVPVDMKDLGDAAENSPKGQEALGITLLNPLSVYKMLYQNMAGKRVIAIAATGLKAMFMWNFYANDILNKAKEGVDYTIINGEVVPMLNSDFDFLNFAYKTKRIIGRQDKENFKPKEVIINTLPDVNLESFDKIESPELAALFIDRLLKSKLNPKIKTDIMNSLMISAATDNAKELILKKINAGSKLAKCYLYLITLGFDLNDIVAFMTSDIIEIIDLLSNPNIFNGTNYLLPVVVKSIKNYLIDKKTKLNKEVNISEEVDDYTEDDTFYKMDSVIEEILPSDLTGELIDSYLQDIVEFLKILEGANEFSNLGAMFRINLGIVSKTEDLETVLQNFRGYITSREKELKIVKKGVFNRQLYIDTVGEKDAGRYIEIAGGNFDPVKWLLNEEVRVPKVDAQGKVLKTGDGEVIYEETPVRYRLLTSEYYNKIKHSINIFAIADYVPHFSKMFELLGSACTVNEFAMKSRILKTALEKIRKENPDFYLEDDYYSKILRFATKLIITKFITEKEKLWLPIEKGTNVFNNNRLLYRADQGILNVNSEEGIASFKYYFENVIIPGLQAGTFLPDLELSIMVKNNTFILSLMRGNDRGVPMWKTNIDMLSDSVYTTVQLSKYSKALNQLSNVMIGSHSLADWFALYNLIVNNNRYGSDRLTRVFDVFVNEFDKKGNSLINKYLSYVGDLDYDDLDVNLEFNFSTRDLFLSQARTVNSFVGKNDPVLAKIVNGTPRYYMKKGYNYVEIPSLLTPIPGESITDRLTRYAAQNSYFLLGNPYASYLSLMKLLLEGALPGYAIAELIRTGTIKFKIDCV